jgi:hypothetical protein
LGSPPNASSGTIRFQLTPSPSFVLGGRFHPRSERGLAAELIFLRERLRQLHRRDLFAAAEELLVRRPPGRRTSLDAIELVRQHRACRDEEIATALNTAGFSTGTGQPFDVAAVRWLRHVHKIQVPSPLAPGEVAVADVAATFGITEGAVYYWIEHGQLHARQDDRGQWCVPFPVEVKETCRQWLLASTRIKPRTLDVIAGGAV